MSAEADVSETLPAAVAEEADSEAVDGDLAEEKASSSSSDIEEVDDAGTDHDHSWRPRFVIHTGRGRRKADDSYEEFECPQCPLIAPTQADVDEHVAKEHPAKPRVTCDECGKDFARKYELQAHVKVVHLGIKDQKCPHCDYVTSDKGRVKKHVQQVHMNVRNYSCPHCDYSAKNKSGLDNHVNAIHLKRRKYSCEHCSYTSVQSGQMATHVKMRHSEGAKPFECDSCDYRASDKSLLRRHVQQRHLKVKNHICSECGYGSVTRTQLEQHYEKKHGGGLNDDGSFGGGIVSRRGSRGGPKVFNVQKLLAKRGLTVPASALPPRTPL